VSAVSSPSGVRGGAPAAHKRFLAFYRRQMAFPGITLHCQKIFFSTFFNFSTFFSTPATPYQDTTGIKGTPHNETQSSISTTTLRDSCRQLINNSRLTCNVGFYTLAMTASVSGHLSVTREHAWHEATLLLLRFLPQPKSEIL